MLSLMLLWTSVRRRRATVATPGEWQCKTGGVRRLAVANKPNIFQIFLLYLLDCICVANAWSVEVSVLHSGQCLHVRYVLLRSLRFRTAPVVGNSVQCSRVRGHRRSSCWQTGWREKEISGDVERTLIWTVYLSYIALHDADTDTDTDFLARILARKSRVSDVRMYRHCPTRFNSALSSCLASGGVNWQ